MELETFEDLEKSFSDRVLTERSIAHMNTFYNICAPVAKERRCLKCDFKFLSKVGNRVCLECKKDPAHNFYGEAL